MSNLRDPHAYVWASNVQETCEQEFTLTVLRHAMIADTNSDHCQGLKGE